MKKIRLLIATVLLAGISMGAFAQENIRAMIRNFENSAVIETDIINEGYPIVKKINQSTTRIKLASSPILAQQLEDAFRQDREKTIHAVEQKRDDKVYMFYRFGFSTYSYTRNNELINIVETINSKRQVGLYSFFVNVVPDDFRFPLVGFINTAIGSHKGLQAGFVNTTLVDFDGAQIGFVNSAFNDNDGLQAGFANATINKSNGVQAGFANIAGSLDGWQVGFANMVRKETNGAQIGFANLTGGRVNGVQIGFINYADTVAGAPIGLISIVRKGGYRAVEVSVNEWYPVNLSFKIGVPKFYTFVQWSYNSGFENQFAVGYGVGSLLPLSKKIYFNPEASSIDPIGINYHMQIQSLVGNISYKLSPHMQIAAGPSISHIYTENENNLYNPRYYFLNTSVINNRNRIVVGARAALSINF